ncbi:MAG: tRNA preQ1(34) S-adenosylmethionine ribosyltransferase-isomerase QueA [Bacillota bacterium]
MKTSDFKYDLPEEQIAQEPADQRDHSKLMVLNKNGHIIEHSLFYKLFDFLKPGDRLVFNNSKVIPARLYGEKVESEIEIEVLLLTEIEKDKWEVLVKPGRRVKKGTEIIFGDNEVKAVCEEYTDFGGRVLKFEPSGKLNKKLKDLGEMPLPPYITKTPEDPGRYQTVYADSTKEGSAAAPTAGLHFTHKLLKQLKDRGIGLSYLTLHVGLGTFRPVKVDDVEEHDMHSEYYEISAKTAKEISDTMKNGGRIVAVGTTSVRALESSHQKIKQGQPQKGWTDIFIYPGYEYKLVDGLITNFHLPGSTLIMLVAALVGKDEILDAYQIAVKEDYRFYSFGDAMLII